MQAPTSAVQIRSVPLPNFNVAYKVTRNDFRSGNGDLLQQSLYNDRYLHNSSPTSAVQIRSVPLPTFNVAYLVTRNDFRSGNGDLLQQSLESPRHQWTYMDLTSVDPK